MIQYCIDGSHVLVNLHVAGEWDEPCDSGEVKSKGGMFSLETDSVSWRR